MSRPGRPLRVLGLAGLALPLWLAIRVPDLQRRYAAIMAAMVQPSLVGWQRHQRPVPAVPKAFTVTAPMQQAGVAVRWQAAARQPRSAGSRRLPVPQEIAVVPTSADPIAGGPGPPAPSAAGAFSPLGASPGFDLATEAYRRLAAGDRRDADRLFASALTAAPDAPQAGQWMAERRRLNQHWSGDAFALFRDAGPAASAAASPVLGGGQSGATLAYAYDPLARRPLAGFARVYAAHDHRGLIDDTSLQAALGVRWRPLPGVNIAAERLIRVGRATSGDWNLRISAGGEQRFGPAVVDGYGEAGARGNGDLYAGGQAHAMLPLGRVGPARITTGPGLWASAQSGFRTVYRVDIGAGIAAGLPHGVTARAEWRWRAAGNAAPDSGPALTLGWEF